jgi:hypothetical protein
MTDKRQRQPGSPAKTNKVAPSSWHLPPFAIGVFSTIVLSLNLVSVGPGVSGPYIAVIVGAKQASPYSSFTKESY